MADKDDEISPGGSRILRHVARDRPFEFAGAGDPELIDEIENHIERWVGEVTTVNHELISDRVHIDVAIAPADSDRPFHTLVTMGMSEAPMQVPFEAQANGAANRVELVMLLPSEMSAATPWPANYLRSIARIPREHDTWLGGGHTVPNGKRARPLVKGTQLAGALVTSLTQLPAEFASLHRTSGEHVEFLALVCVTADEISFKLDHGADALMELMRAAGVSEVLDPARSSLVPPHRRAWWKARRGNVGDD